MNSKRFDPGFTNPEFYPDLVKLSKVQPQSLESRIASLEEKVQNLQSQITNLKQECVGSTIPPTELLGNNVPQTAYSNLYPNRPYYG